MIRPYVDKHIQSMQAVTHQAQQTADLVNGPQAAEEAHEHGESPDCDQDVAGDLNSCGVICMEMNRVHIRNNKSSEHEGTWSWEAFFSKLQVDKKISKYQLSMFNNLLHLTLQSTKCSIFIIQKLKKKRKIWNINFIFYHHLAERQEECLFNVWPTRIFEFI